MQHNAHGVAQGNQVVVAHVTPTHKHGTLGRVVQARDELHERALARARAAEHAHRGARLNTKVDMLEHVLGSIRAVLKRHVAELDASVGNLAHGRVCRRCLDERLLVNHSRNALHAGERAREQQKHVGNHHERVHNQQHVAHKARERAHAQLAGDNHAPADPQDRDGGHIHRQLKHRQVEHGVTEGLRRRVRELGIDGVELGLLVLGAHIRLDGAHGGEVLLHHAIEVVHRGLQLTVERAHAVGDDAQHYCQHGQDNREDRGERARQNQGIDQTDDEGHRSAHHGTKAVADGVLDDGDVGGHAGDKRAGVVVVQVAKGERLDLAILGLAQVGTQARGHTGGRAGIPQTKYQRKCGTHQHARALQQHVVDVARGHAHVDDVGHDDRNKQLERGLDRDEHHTEYGIATVCPQVRKQDFEIAHAGSSPIKRCSQTHVLLRAGRQCQVFRNRFLQGWRRR